MYRIYEITNEDLLNFHFINIINTIFKINNSLIGNDHNGSYISGKKKKKKININIYIFL